MEYTIKMKQQPLRITGLYLLAAKAAGLHKTVFGLAPSARFCSATFFCARKNATHFSLSGAKKRQIQPERLFI
jgi:hypothetical protein